MRKSRHTLIIKDKIIKEDIKVDVKIEEDKQDSLIVTTENKNMFIHLIINYLKKDEKYKIEGSRWTEMFNIILMDRRAAISICAGDTWKQIKHFIDKPRPKFTHATCSICLDEENRCLVSCHKCHADACLKCNIKILKDNEGIIICPFCRNEVGIKQSPMMIDLLVMNMLNAVEHNRLMNL